MATTKLDFARIASLALSSLPSLVAQWLPDGKREGHEYVALNPMRADSKPGSFKINLNTGLWSDFATSDAGGDAVSLYAYLFTNGEQGKAARELADLLKADVRPAQQQKPKKRSEWTPVVPVPDSAPKFRLSHQHYGAPTSTWTYLQADGQLIGYICRFAKPDGSKEIMPAVWAANTDGEHSWRWLSFPKPRPLYRLPELRAKPTSPVLIVEGEKSADAAAALFPHCACLTWPGGAKATQKADWKPLAGRNVVIWPDADEPGKQAAETIAILLDGMAKQVQIVTPPPEVKAGWDLADVAEQGWNAERAQAHARENLRTIPAKKSLSTPSEARASSGNTEAWRGQLVYGRNGAVDCRENVIYALRDHPAWRDILAADEFSKRIVVRKPSPIGQKPGDEWSEDADTRLALWLLEEEAVRIRTPDTILQAVRHVARLNTYHPVREFLEGLVWDQRPRVDTWTTRLLGAPDTQYARMIGRYFLINMVRRIFGPGCIMRSVPVLEGLQNKGKSTALRNLSQPWFSDTMFRVGDKDAYIQIQGVWLYEISELESFTRAEATAVKAFVSSRADNFRAPYERTTEKHLRQTCFAATTNAIEYLKDWTGNTRFWPLETGVILLDEISAERDQLLAEAMVLYRQGERSHPTAEQETELFEPEQSLRMMVHPWEETIADYCDNPWRTQVTVNDLLIHIGFKSDKLNPQGAEAQRVGSILKSWRWTKHRVGSRGSRRYEWHRPPETPEEAEASREPGADGDQGEDDVPF